MQAVELLNKKNMKPPQVRITRRNNFIVVDPDPALEGRADLLERLKEELTYTHMEMLYGLPLKKWLAAQKAAGNRATNKKYTRRRLYKIMDNRLVCLSGLTARVCRLLAACNARYEIFDLRNVSFPDPDYEKLGELRGQQDEVIAAIAATDHGVIDMATGAGKTHLFPDIVSMWPTVRTMIVAPRLSIVKTIAGYMRNRGVDCGICTGSEVDIRRVTVCSSKSMHKMRREFPRLGLLLYDEVYTAASSVPAAIIPEIENARRYGFADGPFNRLDGCNMVVEALFGPTICRVGYQAAVGRSMVSQIKVLASPVPSADNYIPYDEFRLDINKKHTYWANRRRNVQVARSVRVAAERLGVPYEDCQILVLVETVEHALRLHSEMPDFVVCHAGGINAKRKADFLRLGFDPTSINLSKSELEENQSQFERGVLKRVIATPIWSAGVNFVNLQILVRADGRTSKIENTQLPGRLSRLKDGKEFGLLVDFDDQFSPWAQARAARRFAYYKSRGWETMR